MRGDAVAVEQLSFDATYPQCAAAGKIHLMELIST